MKDCREPYSILIITSREDYKSYYDESVDTKYMLQTVHPSFSRSKAKVKSYDEIDLLGSCSLNFQNRLLFFGSTKYSKGWGVRRQIVEISGCQVKKIGSLEFSFSNGLCATNSKEIFLCYDTYSSDGCKKATGSSITL